ncbi:MAG: hypothetical protein VX871_08170 [Pseudomonadota bacterium]|nr:hypothetical protein [Pseudomonadota bacterium]
MFDKILSIATAMAVALQIAVGAVFLGSLATVSLMAFSVVPSTF